MNLADLSRDEAAFEAWRRRAFPFFEQRIFLTHASVATLPAVARDALIQYSTELADRGQFDFGIEDQMYAAVKARTARLMQGVRTSEADVAFAGSTSHAIGLVATGIDWKPGDNCVVAEGDFPANVVTWKNLEQRHGVEVRLIPHQPRMEIGLADVQQLVDERTRIVSLCSANFLSGYPLDLNTIGQWLHQHGILFCVDAIQTLGAIEFDATYVDFACADAHKWLLGPHGIAVLWMRPEARRRLRPAILGWLATQGRDNWYAYDTTPRDNADAFEPGARNFIGAVALDAALKLREEAGPQWVESRVVELRNHAARVLEAVGCELLWRPEPHLKSGIVSFRHPGIPTDELFQKISTDFALSLRADKQGDKWIRVSASWENTHSDLDKLAARIASVANGV